MNRRDRRKARARARRALRLATRPCNSYTVRSGIPDHAAKLFRTMRPARSQDARAPMSIPRESVQILQVLTARGTGEHTKRKRTVRYKSTPDWKGHRLGHSLPGARLVRIINPKRKG